MKKIKDREIQGLILICVITALIADVLCVLFLFNVVQYRWFLNFIGALAILLHTALALLAAVRKKIVLVAAAAVFTIAYIVVLVLLNV